MTALTIGSLPACAGTLFPGVLPRAVAMAAGRDLSRWCLVAAIAGIGMEMQLRELATVGIKPVLMMIGENVFLAAPVPARPRWAN